MGDNTLMNFVLQSDPHKLGRVHRFCNQQANTNPFACTFGVKEPIIPCFPEAPYDISGALLIVGGAGYIGVNTINTIFYKFPDLNFVMLDNLSAANADQSNILQTIRDDARYTFINGNMNDVSLIQDILTDHSVSLILHLAAYMPWMVASNSHFLTNNVNGLDTFLEACAPYCETGQIKNILYQSTLLSIMESSFVYNSTNYTNTYPQPPNIYTTTKTAAADIASYYNRSGTRMPITMMFPSHIFGGDYQHQQDVLLYYQTQLGLGNKLTVYPDFNIYYDNWISVYDIIDAYILILLKGYDGSTYNLVNPSQSLTYLDTTTKVIQQQKPGQPINNWLTNTTQHGAFVGQTKGFIKPSNLGCFNPTITLQSEINKMSISTPP